MKAVDKQRILPHRVSLGSLMGPQLDNIIQGESIHVLYSDPPWGDGYLKMFATYTEKVTGKRPVQPTHAQMCARYAQLVQRHVTGYVFIETSLACSGEFIAALRPVVGTIRHQQITYANELKAILIMAAMPGKSLPAIRTDGLKGIAFVTAVLRTVEKRGAFVLDPCCGAGYTARAAKSLGMIFRGNELNPARLEKTIAHLSA
jgi:hypothetical protein